MRSPHVPRLLALGLALLVPAAAAAQTPTETQALKFGRIAIGASSGSVRVQTGGGISCGPHSCLGGQLRGSFSVTGSPLQSVSISFSTGDLVTRQGGSETLGVQNLVDNRGGSFVLDVFGNGSFFVGGDLVIPVSTVAGDYVGTYTVTVNSP